MKIKTQGINNKLLWTLVMTIGNQIGEDIILYFRNMENIDVLFNIYFKTSNLNVDSYANIETRIIWK